jgi:phage-related protein
MPTTSYNAGTAYISLRPSLQGFPGKLRTELRAVNETVQVGVEADLTGFRAELRAGVDAAAGAVRARVAVELDADTAGLRAELAAIGDVRVRVLLDPDVDQLRAWLRSLQPFEVRVDLDPDLAALRARLAATSLTASVNVDADRSGSLGRAAAAASTLAGNTLRAGAAVAALGSAVPAVVGLAGALAQAAGAGALLPAALAGAAGGFAALKIGASGVSDAFSALGAADTSSAAASAQAAQQRAASARQVQAAQESLADAQRAADRSSIQSAQAVASARQGLADAQIQAARRVEQAERTLANAQAAARSAQEALTRARADAVEQLEDLKLSLAGAALDEEAAVLALERAQERLANMPAGSTALDFKEAELAVRQASQALDETRERYGDVQAEAAAAQRAGVDGSDQVREAQQQLAAANTDVADAERGLVDARTEGARQVADAQAALAGAQQQAAWAQEDATRQVARAQADLAAAIAATAESGTPAMTRLADALSKLSPEARGFVSAVQALKPAWDALRLDVQDALFRGLAGTITNLANAQLPGLSAGLSAIASGFNLGAREVAGFLSSAGAVRDVRAILEETGRSTGLWTSALAPITAMFLDIAAVGAPILTELAGSFLAASERAAAFIANARSTGQIEQWIRGGLDAISQFGELLGNIGGSIGAIFQAAQTAGTGTLGPLLAITGEIERFLTSAAGQDALVTIFQTLRSVTDALLPGIRVLGDALAGAVVQLAPALTPIAQALSAVLDAVSPLLPVVAELVSYIGIYLAEAFLAASPLLRTIADVVGTVLTVAFEALQPVLRIMLDAVRDLTPVLSRIAESIGGLLVAAIEAIAPILPPLVEAFYSIVDALLPVVDIVIAFATQLIQALAPVLPQIADMVVRLVEALIPMIDPLIRIAQQLLPLLVGALATSLQHAADFAGFLVDVLVWTLENLVGPALELIAGVVEWFAKTIEGGWQSVIRPAWDQLGAAATWLWDVALRPVFEAIGAGWRGLVDAMVWVWENLLKPSWEAISGAATWLWENALRPTFEAIGAGWRMIIDGIVWVWENILRPCWDGIMAAATWMWENVLRPVFDAIAGGWRGLMDGIAWVWENILRPVFDAIGGAVDIVRAAFDTAVEGIRIAWEKIRGIVAGPIKFMVDVVYKGGIVPAWNFIAGLVGLAKLDPNQPALGFATGGPVPYDAPGARRGRDSVRAMLMPGEYVLSEEGVRGLGGLSAVDQLHQQARGRATGDSDKGTLRALQSGRTVDGADHNGPGSRTTGFGGVRPHVAQAGWFLKNRFGIGVVGGVGGRPNASDHPSGHALDFMTRGDNGTQLANYAVSNARHLMTKYVIWRQRINSGSGWRGMEDRGGDTANHFDHVHVSFLPAGGAARDFSEAGAEAGIDPFGLVMQHFGGLMGKVGEMLGLGDNQWVQGAVGMSREMVQGAIDKAVSVVTSWFGFGGGAKDAGPVSGGKDVKAQVRGVAARYGWSTDPQWAAIDRLVQKESSWNPNAANPTSSARGLFQKMTSIHGPIEPTPAGQAEWGLNYIRGRYGTPVSALDFHNRNNYYDEGGVGRGRGIMLKNILAPERVLSPRQNVAFEQLVSAAVGGYRGTSQGPVMSPEQWATGSRPGDGALIGSLSVSAGEGASARDIIDEAMWQARSYRNASRYTR